MGEKSERAELAAKTHAMPKTIGGSYLSMSAELMAYRTKSTGESEVEPRLLNMSNWLPDAWHPRHLTHHLSAIIRAGITTRGDLGRLHDALSRQVQGDGLLVAALGASVTADFGGAVGLWQDRYPVRHVGYLRSCTGASQCARPGWLLPVLSMISSLGAQRPSADANARPDKLASASSTMVNCGKAGSSIARYLECTASLVPEMADVIIVDAATVDYRDLQARR